MVFKNLFFISALGAATTLTACGQNERAGSHQSRLHTPIFERLERAKQSIGALQASVKLADAARHGITPTGTRPADKDESLATRIERGCEVVREGADDKANPKSVGGEHCPITYSTESTKSGDTSTTTRKFEVKSERDQEELDLLSVEVSSTWDSKIDWPVIQESENVNALYYKPITETVTTLKTKRSGQLQIRYHWGKAHTNSGVKYGGNADISLDKADIKFQHHSWEQDGKEIFICTLDAEQAGNEKVCRERLQKLDLF